MAKRDETVSPSEAMLGPTSGLTDKLAIRRTTCTHTHTHTHTHTYKMEA